MALSYILPNGDVSSNNIGPVGGPASLWAAVDDGPNIDLATAFADGVIWGSTTGGNPNVVWDFTDTALTGVVFNAITLYIVMVGEAGRSGNKSTNRWCAVQSSLTSSATTVNGTVQYLRDDGFLQLVDRYPLNPNTNLPWTLTTINAVRAGWAQVDSGIGDTGTGQTGNAETSPYNYQTYIEIDYSWITPSLDQNREIATRQLLINRRGRNLLEVTVPLGFVDCDIMSDLVVSHYQYVDVNGAQLGLNRWARRNFRVLRSVIHPGSNTVTLTLRDLRDGVQLRTYWDTMQATESSPLGTGLARLGVGGQRTYTRTNNAWINDPSDGRVVKIDPDIEKYDQSGLLIEKASTNAVLNSSAISGLTSWTPDVAGRVTLDTGDLLFDSSISAQSFKFTADGTNFGYMYQAGIAGLSNNVAVSIDYKRDTNTTIGWLLQRASDGKWWDVLTGTWLVATTNNLIASPAAVGTKARFTYTVPAGATPGNLTFYFGNRETTNGATCHCYHMQLESSDYATSRIPTTTVAVTRSKDNQTISLGTGNTMLPMDAGTAFLQVQPANWSNANRTTNAYFMRALIDANNEVTLYWRQSDNKVVFLRKVAGVSYEATVSAATTLFSTTNRSSFVMRWMGSEGELNASAGTMTLTHVESGGIVGSNIAPLFPSGTTGTTFYLGSLDATQNYVDGYLRNLIITPFVLDDSECLRLPKA